MSRSQRHFRKGFKEIAMTFRTIATFLQDLRRSPRHYPPASLEEVMTRPSLRLSLLSAGAVALTAAIILSSTDLSFTDAASAQAGRTIKIVVPFAPGGAASVLARVLADEVGAAQRVTTVVENRQGAAGAIGTEAVARAAPDGNTLLIMSPA